jgi:hypothetical protein
MKRFILVAMFCPMLQGCVGGLTATKHTEVISNPVIALYRDVPDRVTKQTTNSVVFTSERLQSRWGKPDHIGHVAGSADELWTYKCGRIWEGVIPCIIIPIPLILPIGSNEVVFKVHDGYVVSASSSVPWISGGIAGFLPSPEGGGGFGATSYNEEF